MYNYLQSHLDMYIYCKNMRNFWFLLSDKSMHLYVGMYVFAHVCKNILIPLRKLLVPPTYMLMLMAIKKVSCFMNQTLF